MYTTQQPLGVILVEFEVEQGQGLPFFIVIKKLSCFSMINKFVIFHCPAQARRDEATGRDFFIDHNTRRTTWERPPSPMASAGGTTPEEATPVGGSPEGSSGDLAARDAEATGNAAASAAAGDAAAEGAGVGGDLAEREEYGGAQPRRGWGLFGLRVDEVPAFGISL